MLRFHLRLMGLSCAMCACVACGQADPIGASRDSSSDTNGWVNNGATACEKYLTPDVIGAIFKDAEGQSHMQDAQTCIFEAAHQPNHDFSTITISLRDGGSSVFETDSTTRNGTPIRGIGDSAVRTQEDGVQALKGDRICSIYVKPPNGNKLSGDAMAQELGQVCNKLFDLP
jgi:hypothetical protein